MKLYNNQKNSYEELLTYYPAFYREVYEMTEILKAQGRLADNIQNSIEQIFADQFIDSADEGVISSYEKMSGIVPDFSKAIEERRKAVKAHLIGSGKMSKSVIADMIRVYTDGDTVCHLELFDKSGNNRLYIVADRGNSPNIDFSQINLLLSEKLPAHLEYELSFQYQPSLLLSFEREVYTTEIPVCGQYFCGEEVLF